MPGLARRPLPVPERASPQPGRPAAPALEVCDDVDRDDRPREPSGFDPSGLASTFLDCDDYGTPDPDWAEPLEGEEADISPELRAWLLDGMQRSLGKPSPEPPADHRQTRPPVAHIAQQCAPRPAPPTPRQTAVANSAPMIVPPSPTPPPPPACERTCRPTTRRSPSDVVVHPSR